MTKQELERIGEYTEKDTVNPDEQEDIVLLLLKWMYEQGMLQ